MKLNELASQCCQRLIERATPARVAVFRDESGVRIVDCGVHVTGGLEAGRAVAEICLAGLGQVDLLPGDPALWPGLAVRVYTDQPVAACMASQYAGWQIAGERFFAMGSGPMRALRGREPLFDQIGFLEKCPLGVGVLESGKLPQQDVCHHIVEECSLDPEQLTLLVAPTTSVAGTIQVAARTVETALHKMHELGFDIGRVISGFGVAPLSPVAADELAGIGRTNDAVLYGGEVVLWVKGDDDSLREYGPRIPSSGSADYGQPFAKIFADHNRDFYQVDPLLFSPGVIQLVNIDTGRSHRFGQLLPEVIQRSFSE